MRMKTKFMMVYRLFRLKKYNEPIGPVIPRKKLPSVLKAKEVLLDIVNEEEDHDSDRENDKTSILEYMRDNIFEDIVYEFILLHADSVVRVHSFLLMLIHRRRYAKLKSASGLIQSRCKQYLARMRVRKLRQEKIDAEKTRRLEKHLQAQRMVQDHAQKIEWAARKIQSLYHRLKFKKELKEMRKKLKSLPYAVRRSYVKMQELKLSTMQLANDTSNKFTSNGKR
jgi:hypothetical protein